MIQVMAAPQLVSSRLEYEDLWLSRLAVANRTYRIASDRSRRITEKHSAGLTPVPNASFAIQQAREIELEARQEYTRILGIFTDLMLYGKAPDQHH
jgi:hypothetical protein